MKQHEKVQAVLKELEEVGGVPSDQEFYNEFDFRLREKLDLDSKEENRPWQIGVLMFTVLVVVFGVIYGTLYVMGFGIYGFLRYEIEVLEATSITPIWQLVFHLLLTVIAGWLTWEVVSKSTDYYHRTLKKDNEE